MGVRTAPDTMLDAGSHAAPGGLHAPEVSNLDAGPIEDAAGAAPSRDQTEEDSPGAGAGEADVVRGAGEADSDGIQGHGPAELEPTAGQGGAKAFPSDSGRPAERTGTTAAAKKTDAGKPADTAKPAEKPDALHKKLNFMDDDEGE